MLSVRYISAILAFVQGSVDPPRLIPESSDPFVSVRSSMLELAILGELEQPLHGYELRKRLSRSLGTVRRLSFGSLYPALHRLADRGLIRVVDATGVPEMKAAKLSKSTRAGSSTMSQASRQVVYQVTPVGREYLNNALSKAAVDDESMPLTMGLMSRAAPATRLTLLMQRRAQVLERHEASQSAKQSSDFWIRSKGELDSQQTLSELSWIDRMIQTDPQLKHLTNEPGLANDKPTAN